MREKSEVEKYVRIFITMIKIQFARDVKVVRTDNGCEFKTGSIRDLYAQYGIIHQISCVETPQ